MKKITLITALLYSTGCLISQTSMTGGLNDATSGEALVGATIYVSSANKGTITDFNGSFKLDNLPTAEVEVSYSFIGYEKKTTTVTLSTGENNVGTISLNPTNLGLKEVEVIASIAKDRMTPVAATTLGGKFIEENVGNQEYPEILRNTPSVYVTKQGGGFGDSRINVRGFDQRNTAVMINGIPVNDMENGWVYWSNWAGLSDVTSKLQVQRGLGASKLAVPAVGGSINIVTNAADFEKGGSASTTVGNDGYTKYAVALSSGQMDNGLATTMQFTHTRGDGYVDGTKFRAYSYFLSTNYKINDKQSISGTVLGAPQWHHQRVGYGRFDNLYLSDFQDNIRFNYTWGQLDGEEFNWRRNFYHKPKAFLNHYLDISEKTSLKTSAYISLGIGGGTGPRGRVQNDSGRVYDSFGGYGVGIHDENGQVRFDDIVAYNKGELSSFNDAPNTDPFTTTSSGDGFIRRASMNSHTWYGILSTLDHKANENLSLTAGIDARYYKGEHYRRLENLLGNTSYVSRSDDNFPSNTITTASPAEFGNFLDRSYEPGNNVLAYYNDGLVSWMGLFGQVEYSTDVVSAFVSANGSQQGFKRIDYFNYLSDAAPGSDTAQATDWQNFLGGNVKAGFNYNINNKMRAFVNAGYFSRQPIFDNVFLNYVNDINEDVNNQTVTAFEAGYGYFDGKTDIDVNAYYTVWGNRQFDQTIRNAQDEDVMYVFEGVSQTHTGVELEVNTMLNSMFTVNAMLSAGNWVYTSDFTATGTNLDTQQSEGELTVYGNGLKVGDAAQTTASLGLVITPIKDLRITGNFYYADNLFARYSIDDPTFQDPNNDGVVQLPAYSLINAGVFYTIELEKFDIDLRANVNNVLDTKYISEMWTNNADDPATPEDEFLTTNQGWYGFGRTWNFGVKVRF